MRESIRYLPVLKWRQGEYQALFRLTDDIKDRILPLIVIPPVEYDFEEQRPKKTVQEHVEPFAKRYATKWGNRNSLIDLHASLEASAMDSGILVITHVFESLRPLSMSATPVIRMSQSMDYLSAIKSIISHDKNGVAIRLKMPDLIDLSLNDRIDNLIRFLELDYSEVDLIVDLEVPDSFEPYSVFAKALSVAIKKISSIVDLRLIAIVGTSLKLSEIRKPGGEPVRHEWLLYKELSREISDVCQLVYGDYTIETPDFISQDMRLLKPAGKIIYTLEKSWLVPKGTSFRDDNAQMVTHCKSIVESGYYCGEGYSTGDKRINETFHGIQGPGNQGTWKEVGVSHHITFVVNQISKLHVR